jgi:hypothetical protein
LIYLHGNSETGKDLRKLTQHDPGHYAQSKIPIKDFPYSTGATLSEGIHTLC